MQKPEGKYGMSKGAFGAVKPIHAQNGGTKGHSKPSTGGTQAGPPPPPQPKK